MTFLKPLINQHDILKSCTRTCFNNHHWTEIDRKWKLTQSANSVLDTIVTAVDNVSDCRSPPHCSQKMGHIEYIYWEHYWICAMSTTLTALVYHDNMPPGESVGRHRALQCCSAAVLQMMHTCVTLHNSLQTIFHTRYILAIFRSWCCHTPWCHMLQQQRSRLACPEL